MAETESRAKRRLGVAAGSIVVVALAVIALLVFAPFAHRPSADPPVKPSTASLPTPTPTTTQDAVPPQATQATLAARPLAFFDAVIPALPDPASLRPQNLWQTATPRSHLVGLYSGPNAASPLIAALGSTVPTIKTPTAVAVYGRQGGMILISTPSRRTVPGTPSPSAPSATFAWARAADFTLTSIDKAVRIDNAASTISVVTRDGKVEVSAPARLGTPTDPTPAATSTYMEANYIDPRVTYTQGNPISLTGAHSSLLAGYGGNSALTALHFYPDVTGNSHGCVRISAVMTQTLSKLPVGTPIVFS